MSIGCNFSAFKNLRWGECGIRFLFGGLITVATGWIGRKYGPGIAGLFLAFPAIFPASATLIEKHEEEKRRKTGHDGRPRGRAAAALDAAGAALGALGLIVFSLLFWKFPQRFPVWTALVAATMVWMAVAWTAWELRRRL